MKKILLSVAFLVLLASCKKDDTTTNPIPDCGDKVKIVSDTLGLHRHIFGLIDTDLDGNCLTLRVSYGGGCTGTVDFQLYSFGEYKLDGVTHKKVFISLLDEDDCEALIEKRVKFDLTELTNITNGSYYINFVNANDSLLVGG